ncbi:MAG TPA: helix-turn-helix domain-containing protein [Actinomycetes bacterium]|nr:helix-turn-helix domain-containing protein [Actinomycetes bacterium]
MPKPYPLYHPEFAPEDVATLEGLVRRTSLAHRVVQRAKLALLLHHEPGVGNAEAARRLGQHPNWVCTWRKRWTEEGFSVAALEDRPRAGRPVAVSPPGAGDGRGGGL